MNVPRQRADQLESKLAEYEQEANREKFAPRYPLTEFNK
ncbi:Uncharacterized protein dnm_073710 [Desulfonema magnum]|uniref:Uncharacterized protein n=1 Tax=Desulfonema magnum TaxID=45655 RepID=A0A975BTN1_9BACT|nr:Uncharacterized protein dnm_073710 [Desulfonema magnum]